jgi:hypothetical protein
MLGSAVMPNAIERRRRSPPRRIRICIDQAAQQLGHAVDRAALAQRCTCRDTFPEHARWWAHLFLIPDADRNGSEPRTAPSRRGNAACARMPSSVYEHGALAPVVVRSVWDEVESGRAVYALAGACENG